VGRSVVGFGKRWAERVVGVFRQGIKDSNEIVAPHVVRFTGRV
jgi:hypothetical protein